MRAILIALAFGALLQSDGVAQERAQPGCADVARDIDRYADQDVSFYGRVHAVAVKDGAIVIVFGCSDAQGEAIPGVFFGIAIADGVDSMFSRTPNGAKRLLVTGRVLSTEVKLFSGPLSLRSPPSFSGPYLHRATFKAVE